MEKKPRLREKVRNNVLNDPATGMTRPVWVRIWGLIVLFLLWRAGG